MNPKEWLEDKNLTHLMFDRIAPTYDLLNRILSMGIDQKWRQELVDLVPTTQDKLSVLDVATGTGDLLLQILSQRSNVEKAEGLDPSVEMLALAQKKAEGKGIYWAQWTCGNAAHLPQVSDSLDVVSISFGIRNVQERAQAFSEFFRVLKTGGKLLILELSLPKIPWLREAYLFYFREILPWIGGLVSKEKEAYQYLNQSVESFPSGRTLLLELKQDKWSSVGCQSLTGGIATLYWAIK